MDPKFMELAIESAQEGINEEHGGPFGACVVHNGEVVSVAHNTVLKDKDPSCHAEINAIRQACQHLGTHVLKDCELYTTAEPCPMCLAAIYWARIPKVYVGVDRNTAARYGFDDAFFYEELEKHSDEREVEITHGVLSRPCQKVFADWKARSGQLY